MHHIKHHRRRYRRTSRSQRPQSAQVLIGRQLLTGTLECNSHHDPSSLIDEHGVARLSDHAEVASGHSQFGAQRQLDIPSQLSQIHPGSMSTLTDSGLTNAWTWASQPSAPTEGLQHLGAHDSLLCPAPSTRRLRTVELATLGTLTAVMAWNFSTARASSFFRVVFAVCAVAYAYLMVLVLYEAVRTRLWAKPLPDGATSHLI